MISEVQVTYYCENCGYKEYSWEGEFIENCPRCYHSVKHMEKLNLILKGIYLLLHQQYIARPVGMWEDVHSEIEKVLLEGKLIEPRDRE